MDIIYCTLIYRQFVFHIKHRLSYNSRITISTLAHALTLTTGISFNSPLGVLQFTHHYHASLPGTADRPARQFSLSLLFNMNNDRTGVLLDRERVTCLLLINTQLMKKAINLYVNVLTNQQALQQLLPQNKQQVVELYQNCTRRLHCNLAVLSTLHEKYHSSVQQPAQPNKPQFPVIMSAPPDMPELNQLYTKLQELYPDAVRFLKLKYQQLRKQAQGTPAASQLGTNAPTPLQNAAPMPQSMPMVMQQTPTNYSPAPSHALPPVATPASSTTFPAGTKDDFMMPSQQSQFSNGFNPQNMNSGYQNVGQEPQMLAMSPQQILQQANTGMMDFY